MDDDISFKYTREKETGRERENMKGCKQRLRLHIGFTIAWKCIGCKSAATNAKMLWISHLTHTTTLSRLCHAHCGLWVIAGEPLRRTIRDLTVATAA